MKHIFIICIAICLGFHLNSQKAESDYDENDKIIHTLIQKTFDEIWSDMDTLALQKYHFDDFIILEHGEVWTNDTIKDYIRRSVKNQSPTTRINKISIIRTKRIDDSTIWAAYHNDATFSIEGNETGKMHWLESVVASKTKDGWKLEMMHSTRAPRKNEEH